MTIRRLEYVGCQTLYLIMSFVLGQGISTQLVSVRAAYRDVKKGLMQEGESLAVGCCFYPLVGSRGKHRGPPRRCWPGGELWPVSEPRWGRIQWTWDVPGALWLAAGQPGAAAPARSEAVKKRASTKKNGVDNLRTPKTKGISSDFTYPSINFPEIIACS